MSDEHAPLRSYGRLKTRQLKPRQAGLLETELPRLSIPLGVDPRTLRPEASELWLEIGFGGGEHMAEQAARHPHVLLLGAEPIVNGVASAVRHLHERGLQNVRLHQGDARDLLAGLPDASLSRVFILFPDPWPKARHNKRRLLQPAFIESLARVMAPGAGLRFATDWRDYAAWTLERMVKSSAFNWTAESAADWRTPPADHVTTRYEEKRLGDCTPVFLDFVRGASC